MRKSYQSEQFLELQAKWYDKLKQKGFQDIEEFSDKYGNRKSFLKRSSKSLSYKYNPTTFQHFRLARNFLEHGHFSSKLDKFIWKLYAEGYSYRDIIVELAKKDIHYSVFFIFKKVRQLNQDMRLFNAYSPEGILDE